MNEDFEKDTKRLWWLLVVMTSVALVIMFSGCKTIHVGQSHDRDSVRVEYRVDSFTHIIRDSVRVQLPCSDSIEVAYVDRWHTEYVKDKSIMHDTISVCSTDTIYKPYRIEVEKEVNSGFAKFCIWWTIGSWLLIALLIMWNVVKLYMRR